MSNTDGDAVSTAVPSKGQVTIPKPSRAGLGISRDDALEFELQPDGRVVLVKVGAPGPVSRFQALRGRCGAGLSTDEIMALTRVS